MCVSMHRVRNKISFDDLQKGPSEPTKNRKGAGRHSCWPAACVCKMLAAVLMAASALGDGLRGVSPSRQSLYDPSKPFTCFDGAYSRCSVGGFGQIIHIAVPLLTQHSLAVLRCAQRTRDAKSGGVGCAAGAVAPARFFSLNSLHCVAVV